MKHSSFHHAGIAGLLMAILLTTGRVAGAGTLDGAKIGLHLKAVAVKNPCSINAPPGMPCEDFPDQGLLGVGYHMYVVASRVPPALGLLGMSFGIDYDGVAGSGADVFAWASCGDLQFPDAAWPGAGSGNIVTWAAPNCQNVAEPNGSGAQAFAGYFYVYAYDADLFSIIERPNSDISRLALADCAGSETDITLADVGQASFSPQGDVDPYNPCGESTIPCLVQPGFLAFGSVYVGDYADRSFTVINASPDAIAGEVSLACPGYSILSGEGGYTLAPSESLQVTVRFQPLELGVFPCLIPLGLDCGDIRMEGIAIGGCTASTDVMEFETLIPGNSDTLRVLLMNENPVTWSGVVYSSCSEFGVIEGAGVQTLLPGDSLEVAVRFHPLTEGVFRCNLVSPCGSVELIGRGDWGCRRTADQLNFGTVPPGSATTRTFTLANEGPLPLSGVVASGCGDFEVTQGAGPYTLAVGDSMEIDVRFAPTGPGPQTCLLDLGVPCGAVDCIGFGTALTPILPEPAGLDFATIPLGSTSTAVFRIRNHATYPVSGTILVDSAEFSILSGGGPYSLGPGESREVTVGFSPLSPGAKRATVITGEQFVDVRCFGGGVDDEAYAPGGPHTLGFHLMPPIDPRVCDPAASGGQAPDHLACRSFSNSGFLGAGYYAYLIATNTWPSPTISAVGLGLQYGNGTVITGWTGCGDQEMFSPDWPGSGSENLISWSGENCQNTLVPGAESEGAHAIAGAFYIYSYAPGALYLTRRSSTADTGPTITDCFEDTRTLPTETRGTLRFSRDGTALGYNPCRTIPGQPVPVELLSFVAERTAAGVDISWEIAGAVEDVAGFHLHRQAGESARVRVTDSILTGALRYHVEDPGAPMDPLSYWLAEHLRTGQIMWHGPTVVAAGPTASSPLSQSTPNPFHSRTAIRFHTETEGPVLLRVFDLAGREIIRLLDRVVPAGPHVVQWDARDSRGLRVHAGIYLYRLEIAGQALTRKLVVLQ